MTDALTCAVLSGAAYKTPADAELDALSVGYELEYFWDLAPLQVVLFSPAEEWGPADRQRVLAFRGTQFSTSTSLHDIASNFGLPRPYGPLPQGCVHGGYRRHFDRIYESTVHATLVGLGEPFVVTGHSMGGALATLFCAVNGHLPITGLHAFAAPACLTRSAHSCIRTVTRTYYVDGDFVKLWPPFSRLLGARPVPSIVRLEAPPGVAGDALKCHWVESYINALRALD